MKTAILISGHMRSFERCLPTLHWHVFRHFPGADFFVSTEPDADAPKAELLRTKYPQAKVSIDTTPQPAMDQFVPAGEPWAHAPYAISVTPQAVLGQLWRLECVWEFFRLRSILNYQLIIRCRPDLWFESATGLREVVHSEYARTPWWGRFGGVNDRFAILGQTAADYYFTTWSQIPALISAGCPLHPESLVRAALEAGGCEIEDTLDVSFSTLRANGERRFPEISVQDIAHFRG